MEYITEIGNLAKVLGLSPANVAYLIALGILYKLLRDKDRVIDKLSNAVTKNSLVMTELRTFLTVALARGGGQ